MTTAVVAPATKLTVTEALAEIKTLAKRIERRRESILPYLWRQKAVTDPLAEDVEGGSREFIKRERQAAGDLELRWVQLRTAIQRLNLTEKITIDGDERTIADWLTWRKEVMPGQRDYLLKLRSAMNKLQQEATSKQVGVINIDQSDSAKYTDVMTNISMVDLAADIEHIELVVGTLDGQLSYKNATSFIEL